MSENIQYHNAAPLEISGRAFENTATPFQRLPEAAAAVVPEKVQHLSEMSAGLYIDFCTDSTEIWARLELLPNPDQEHVGFPHSVDLYTHDRERWQWTGILREMKRPLTEGRLVAGLSEQEKNFRLYLPHAGKIKQLEIGIIEGACFYQQKADPRLPVVCYGTSIVHGFSASRPGMTMPAQLGRRLNTPVVNLGIAGNARMDPELIPFMKQIEASVLTVDCLPNMSPDLVKERTIPFITAIRESHPERPIVLVENIVYQATHGLSDKRGGWGPKNDELKKQFATLISAGMPHLYYLNGEGLLGTDGEATVDGTHPSDLGMMRLTTAYESVLRPLLA
ncbi:SGNH/GDSL hydrolase family protein [Kiritimatiellaeota bacterium B1221]|nr:SGNH/GDSL hydrolase family protein [Kiritimatiellaeota bacterium B1221]